MFNNIEEYKESFRFPIKEWYCDMGFDFNKESYDDVAKEWVAEYMKREHNSKLVEGVKETLEYFKQKNIKQVIISASEKEMLERQLKQLGVDHLFSEIVGVDNIYAAGKKDIAVEWRKKNPAEKILFVGDTDHDHVVACAIEADCILVSSGHQSARRLKELCPVFAVVDNPKKIIELI